MSTVGRALLIVIALGLFACGKTQDGHPAAVASMGACKLEKPIAIGTDELMGKKGVKLTDAILDKPLETEELPASVRHRHANLSLFPIKTNGAVTGHLGGRLEIEGGLTGLGFANDYRGNVNLRGDNQRANDGMTYHTSSKTEVFGKTAETQLKVVVDSNAIVGIQMILPIYTEESESGGTKVLKFKGQHQTVCIMSANKKK